MVGVRDRRDAAAAGVASSGGPAPKVALVGFETADAARVAAFLARLGFEARSVPARPARPEAVRLGVEDRVREARDFDLAVVRLDDPEREAPRWLQAFRQQAALPVVVVCPGGGPEARLAALRAGAEDCLDAAWCLSELALRLRAIYRRLGPRTRCAGVPGEPAAPSEELRLGPLVIHRPFRQARLDGQILPLTNREFELLWLLASHPGRVFSREELLQRLWSDPESGSEDCVTVLVSRLRRKLRDGARFGLRIRALWGVGYRLEGPRAEAPAGTAEAEVAAASAR